MDNVIRYLCALFIFPPGTRQETTTVGPRIITTPRDPVSGAPTPLTRPVGGAQPSGSQISPDPNTKFGFEANSVSLNKKSDKK